MKTDTTTQNTQFQALSDLVTQILSRAISEALLKTLPEILQTKPSLEPCFEKVTTENDKNQTSEQLELPLAHPEKTSDDEVSETKGARGRPRKSKAKGEDANGQEESRKENAKREEVISQGSPALPQPTRENVVRAMTDYSTKHGAAKLKELINGFGAQSLSQLATAKYPEVIQKCYQ